jgi:formate dehydrogenase iron-sulfur subunit
LTAFLGYLLFIFGLLVDLGRPWNIWRAVVSWNHESPMFEVAWCVMLYTFVLFLEFLPAVFEKYRLGRLHSLWNSLVPWLVILMLGLFTQAMTYSPRWTLAMVVILLVWEGLMRAGVMPRDAQVPILLIMSGMIFSTLHQSSLGSLFLIVPHKLHPLWFTPVLPLFFFLSAVMVAPAMVIFESLISERTLGHRAHSDLLSSVGRAMPYLLGVYLLLKVADVVGRGAVAHTFALNGQVVSWWLEISVGVAAPLVLFMTPEVARSKAGLFLSSALVIVGVVWNRLNVAVIGIIVREWETYYPYWAEVFITLGIVSIGLLAFRWATRNLPIYGHEPGLETRA